MSTGTESEEEWCAAQRAVVGQYLDGQHVAHGQVGEWPAWHHQPYIAIWAIESLHAPGWVGWWAISGDLPTDHISSSSLENPRAALAAFARRWAEAASHMSRGESPPGMAIGTPSEWAHLAPLLQSRALLLEQWAADEALWKNDAA